MYTGLNLVDESIATNKNCDHNFFAAAKFSVDRWFCSMVIRRAVKLSHIVCAVFSLSRPRGATRAQIYKFCSLHFNIRQDRRQFNHALQRAEDEDLIICFQQRYHLGISPNRGSDILWSQKFRRQQGRQRKRPRAGAKLPRTRTCKKRVEARWVRFQRNKKETSSCFPCTLEKRRREGMKRRKDNRDKSRLRCTRKKSLKGVILCKSFIFHSKRKMNRKRAVLRRSSRIKDIREVEIVKLSRKKKSEVRSRREHRGKCKCFQNRKQHRQKRKRGSSSKAKKCSKKRSRRDVYRDALRRPTRTVAHAESWDRINYSRRRNERENQELMKDSKMVQRILSARHGPSWDDLNHELRRIKSARSCEVAAGQRPGRKRRPRA